MWKKYLLDMEPTMRLILCDYLASDSIAYSIKFQDELEDKIQTIEFFPYKYRKSTKSKDDNVRDLIFNGYVIPYRINIEKDKIEIIGIFSENEWDA
jgi:hypothetical protein